MRRSIALCGVLSVALSLALGPDAAAAPSEVERAVVLASPGVVFIDTSVVVKVELTYQSDETISGLRRVTGRYAFDYATGSGFVVSPDGVVVTASHVVEPDERSLRNFAANRLILDAFGYGYDDPFARYRITDWGRLNTLLQQCYRGVACDFGIRTAVTVFTALDVAQTELPKGAPAQVLTSTGFENTDVAVLKVNASGLPTVALAETATDVAPGDEVTALGFPGSSRDALETGVTQPTKAFGRVSDIRDQGTWKLIELDADLEGGMSGGPVIGADGRALGLVSFSLLQRTGESASQYLRTVDDIRAALADAGVRASRGPVDAAFEEAMELFWGRHYSAAVPAFQRVLSLYDGHPLAKEYLAEAQAKAGTAADVPVEEPSRGLPIWAIAAGAGVLLVAGLGFGLLRARQRGPIPQAQAAPTIAGSLPVAPGQPVVNGSQPVAGSAGPVGAVQEEPTAQPVAVATVGPRFCSHCGNRLEPAARFCPSCGTPAA